MKMHFMCRVRELNMRFPWLPIDPRVLDVDAMMPYMVEMYGNPHSRMHHFGWESDRAVETAREVGCHH